MKSVTVILLIVSFLEGGMLMSYELLCSKLYTPAIGSSIYVWTSILTMVLLGLAIGYRFGDKVKLENSKRVLTLSLLFTGVFIGITPTIAGNLLPLISGLDIRVISLITGFMLVLFPMIALGLVSPIIIKLLSSNENEIGVNSGLVYFISTIGGVALAMLSVFVGIELLGVHLLISSIAIVLISSGLIVKFLVR